MFSLSKDPNTVTIEFTINGAVSKLSPHVLEVQVYKQINKIARARIKIHDGDVANQKFELIETYTPKIGDTIEIKIGGDPTSVKSTFKGVVSGLSAELNTIYNQIIIDCVDKAFGMTKGRNTSIYLKKKDDAIIKALVGNYSGVTITTDSCTVEHEKLVQ